MTTPVSRLRLRPAALSLLAVLPLALAACGSDDSGDSPSSQASTPPGSSAPATGATAAAAECPPEAGTEQRTTSFPAAPPMCLKPDADYSARVTTDAGAFTVDLLEKKAPNTVNNFVFLARNHFYDGIAFHRVIPGFMIQGGDPQGTGSGGPGYEFPDELPAAGEYAVGSMAMANAGPDTNGSQFFVVTGPNGVSLPPQYSLFGTVTEGMETVKKIEADGSQAGTPTTKHTIQKVEVTQK